MEQIDVLYAILQENIELYESLFETEHDKYDAAIKNDIVRLDEINSKEQVFYLKMRGLEQNRQKLMHDMNLYGKTLKEIIEIAEEEQKPKLKSAYDRLFKALSDVKKVNKQCKTVIDVRLRRIDAAMCKLGERDTTYGPDDNQKNSHKSLMISKKI